MNQPPNHPNQFQMQQIPFNPRVLAYIIAALILLLIGMKTIIIIEPNEKGVVLRLGRALDQLLMPGANFVVPFVDDVYILETEVIHKEEFGYRSTGALNNRTRYSSDNFYEESLIVSGDLNMAEVEWSVQYKINNPKNYLFRIADPVGTLRDLSEAVMCSVIGNRSVYEVLTVGRTEIEVLAAQDLQDLLDQYETGIKVVTLKLQNVLPPDKVKPSYNEVNEAEQYREKLINQAQEQYNASVPRAQGEALQRLEQAEGYRIDRINRARGEADRFINIYNAYKPAKEVTRKRMYLETMTELLTDAQDVTIVDDDLGSLLPLLNLDKKKGGQ